MDRNGDFGRVAFGVRPSLSARRAWIEINFGSLRLPKRLVALRKESVDRNSICVFWMARSRPSLSARRAWIEIAMYSL